MTNDQVTQLLKDYRCYEYAALNCGNAHMFESMPLVISERNRNPHAWDRVRYNRIVTLVKGAVDHVLSDDQRTVIMRKYLDRNTRTLSEISNEIHRDRSTVSRWHTEAINKLSLALEPLTEDEKEITTFNHMFESA
jgi:DNA-directed RNA polymerase specialized sigma subunit